MFTLKKKQPKSVDSIIAQFATVVNELEQASLHHDSQYEAIATRIQDLERAKTGHEEEGKRARSIMQKVKALIS